MSKYKDFNFENCVNHVLQAEGGYVNNPYDRGGETNLGITLDTARVYQRLWAKHGWDGNMRTLPKSLAVEIYKVGYWDRVKGDDLLSIHPLIAAHVFDMTVNSGNRGVKHLQEALNILNNRGRDYPDIVVDGSLGNGTLNALRAYAKRRGSNGLDNLVIMLLVMQANFYREIAVKRQDQEEFMNGWLQRVTDKLQRFTKYMYSN